MHKGLRKFKIKNKDAKSEINIEIDFRKADTKRKIISMVKNRVDWPDLLKNNDGDIVSAFLNELSRCAIRISLSGFNLIEVIKQLNSNHGFYMMDGTHGFTIRSIKTELDLSPQSMDLQLVG